MNIPDVLQKQGANIITYKEENEMTEPNDIVDMDEVEKTEEELLEDNEPDDDEVDEEEDDVEEIDESKDE